MIADDAHEPEIPPGPVPGVIDEHVAANVKRARERLGMSQADLAEKMAAIGWRYHAQTIHRIESGQRKVFIGEAEALARILGTSMERLSWAQGDDAAEVLAGQAISRLRLACDDIAMSVMNLRAAQAGAKSAIQGLRHGTPSARARRAADGVEEELEVASLEDAVGEGEARWERFRSGEGYDGSD